MQYFHNIEKSAFRRHEYVGYAAGTVWRIRKHGCGGWEAYERDGSQYFRARTMAEMSKLLDVTAEHIKSVTV